VGSVARHLPTLAVDLGPEVKLLRRWTIATVLNGIGFQKLGDVVDTGLERTFFIRLRLELLDVDSLHGLEVLVESLDALVLVLVDTLHICEHLRHLIYGRLECNVLLLKQLLGASLHFLLKLCSEKLLPLHEILPESH